MTINRWGVFRFILMMVPFGVSAASANTNSFAPGTVFVANFRNSAIEEYAPGQSPSLFASGNMNEPWGMKFNAAEDLYVASGSMITKVTSSEATSIFADASKGLVQPLDVAFDSNGNLYVADYGNGNIDKFTASGAVSVFATNPSTRIYGMAFDADDNLYVTQVSTVSLFQYIEKYSPAGARSTFYSAGMLNGAQGLAFDTGGNLFVANSNSFDILKISPTGGMSKFANSGGDPLYLAFDNVGNLYATNDNQNSISKFAPDGTVSTFATARLNTPMGIAVVLPEPSAAAAIMAIGAFSVARRRSIKTRIRTVSPA